MSKPLTKNGIYCRVKFAAGEVDRHDGSRSWEILVAGRCIGLVSKDTCWTGDGYSADSYHVQMDLDREKDGELETEATFEVSNCWKSWDRAKMTAPEALRAAREFVRHVVADGYVKVGHEATDAQYTWDNDAEGGQR